MRRGFTLLELLLVLSLVALLVGLVAPAMQRGLDAARERGLVADLEALLASYPMRAFQQGQALDVDEPLLRRDLPDLPADWRIRIDPPLQYAESGLASGGRVSLQAQDRPRLDWSVRRVDGAVTRIEVQAAP